MKVNRLIRLGSVSDALMDNLAINLDAVQSEFSLDYAGEYIHYPPEINFEKPVRVKQLEAWLLEYCRKIHGDEHPLVVCDCLLEDDVLTSADDKITLLSLYRLKQLYTGPDTIRALMFSLIDPLINSLGIDTLSHYDSRGCPMDCWTNDQVGFNKALAKSDFCIECKSLLMQAVSRGQMSIVQIAAIHRILDHVAGRHLCFVLMPFEPMFDRLYNDVIKPAVIDVGWTCLKANEVYEPREIINIIWENIHRADIIVAELTGRNPNVFYELGYAHAAGKNTVLLSQKIEDVPFDLRHRQMIEYKLHEGYNDIIRDKLQKYLVGLPEKR